MRGGGSLRSPPQTAERRPSNRLGACRLATAEGRSGCFAPATPFGSLAIEQVAHAMLVAANRLRRAERFMPNKVRAVRIKHFTGQSILQCCLRLSIDVEHPHYPRSLKRFFLRQWGSAGR